MQFLRTCFCAAAIVLLVFSRASALPAESEVALNVTGGTLHGTLALPAGKGPFPVALIIAGSGPTDRNGDAPGMPMNTYRLLAHALAQRGIASLRYDKRTIGASSMPLKESDLRFGMFVDDAVAWVNRLHSDARFSRVSIVGHSEGSLIGMLAAQRAPVSEFVSLEGAGYNLADVILRQMAAQTSDRILTADVTRVVAALRGGHEDHTFDARLAPLFHAGVQPYLISMFAYDPAAQIALVRVPVLIVQGTTDVQVGMEDAKRLRAAVPSARYVEIAGMNHILRDASADRTANIATYYQPNRPLDARVTGAIAAFLQHGK